MDEMAKVTIETDSLTICFVSKEAGKVDWFHVLTAIVGASEAAINSNKRNKTNFRAKLIEMLSETIPLLGEI